MTGRTMDLRATFDRKISQSICDAVGERLQRNLAPESADLSDRLKDLMDELRRRDTSQ